MRGMEFELEQLLHPASIFDHPRDVLNDPDLTKQEKRAILSSWASDACAIENPHRRGGARRIVSVDEILEALRALDKQTGRKARPGRAGRCAGHRSQRFAQIAGDNGTSGQDVLH